ncbi:MAG: hypothetical protein FJ088_11725 [Deltaproteobacteria bacterium]|nr:hypothetical protein [Deltaproteobacteria bacterium]
MILDKVQRKDAAKKKADADLKPKKKVQKKGGFAGLGYHQQKAALSPSGVRTPQIQMEESAYVDKTFKYMDVNEDKQVSRDEMKGGFAKIAGDDNVITKGELAKFLKSHMGLWGPIASYAAGKIIEALDDDRNGELTVPQLLLLADKIFGELDKDKDHSVSRSEFSKIMDVLKKYMAERN